MSEITKEVIKKNINRHSEVAKEKGELDYFFTTAVEYCLKKGRAVKVEYNKKFKYENLPCRPKWLPTGGYLDIITEVCDDYIDFEVTYEGDRDSYRIPMDLINLYYTDMNALDKFFTDLFLEAVKFREDKIAKEKAGIEQAERARFEELKKKYE